MNSSNQRNNPHQKFGDLYESARLQIAALADRCVDQTSLKSGMERVTKHALQVIERSDLQNLSD